MLGIDMEVASNHGLTRDDDRIFPGENWFFYWKTSASLWQSKMALCPGTTIIVPINWSFHSDTGETYDFAQHRPETHLKKLCDIAGELGKEIIFFVPVSPVPYAPNGGIPHLLARNHSLTQEGIVFSVVDQEESLHKIYSFFDTRVFQAYSRFIKTLHRYVVDSGINALFWGFESLYWNGRESVSFIEDSSKVFDQNFTRFLKAKLENDPKSLEGGAITPRPEEETALKQEFTQTIRDFYAEELKKTMGQYLEGIVGVPFLGTSPLEMMTRVFKQESSAFYSKQMTMSMTRNLLPSTILLPQNIKQKSIGLMSRDLINSNYLKWRLSPGRYEGEEASLYGPLRFFQLISVKSNAQNIWIRNGIYQYLHAKFPWCYEELVDQRFEFSEDNNLSKVLVISGSSIDQNQFHQMLKYFMAGGGVILDRSGIQLPLLKKLEVFLMENSLKVERVQFLTNIHHITLGEGRMIIIDGQQLVQTPAEEKMAFWEKLVSLFNLKQISLDLPEGIECFWRARPARPQELKYEEVRKLSLFNTTSYKKNIVIQLPKSFVFSRLIEPSQVQVKTRQGTIELELLPQVQVSIEVGVFS